MIFFFANLGELEDEFGPYGNEGDDLDLAAILADEEQYADLLLRFFIFHQCSCK